ncbi:hypothetical protein BD310DRAFT_952335 [Dichomitus squalens]|uniref:Uncharacterized protein n=2 Tax=Dichomitus squalens TaxID=114155 RepID=A0A4Q9PDX1_9APHY|nr:hypothetical protein BD310DRAFT_952335 [Dichomitus squalens]
MVDHRRGGYPAVSSGISFGGGQQRVGNLAHTPYNAAILDAVKKSTTMCRIANFANSAYPYAGSTLHRFYNTTLVALCSLDPSLQRNFKGSAFACATWNLGPRAIAHVHTDHLNLAWGMCAITALGDCDPKLGGHLILWDLRLIIEFPPGTTILIPSAIIRHSNAPLASPDEHRYALVQYSAGGLFRWAECGHQTQKNFQQAGGAYAQTGRERWAGGVSMLGRWDELSASRV